MVVDMSLSNLDFSSAGVTCLVQEPVSINIQNIQIFSRLEAELIRYSCPGLSKQSSGLSMNCNRNFMDYLPIIIPYLNKMAVEVFSQSRRDHNYPFARMITLYYVSKQNIFSGRSRISQRNTPTSEGETI